jgi:hypothetical protein
MGGNKYSRNANVYIKIYYEIIACLGHKKREQGDRAIFCLRDVQIYSTVTCIHVKIQSRGFKGIRMHYIGTSSYRVRRHDNGSARVI